jgi:hypothetical protein
LVSPSFLPMCGLMVGSTWGSKPPISWSRTHAGQSGPGSDYPLIGRGLATRLRRVALPRCCLTRVQHRGMSSPWEEETNQWTTRPISQIVWGLGGYSHWVGSHTPFGRSHGKSEHDRSCCPGLPGSSRPLTAQRWRPEPDSYPGHTSNSARATTDVPSHRSSPGSGTVQTYDA